MMTWLQHGAWVMLMWGAGALGGPAALAQDVLPVPALSDRLIDRTATLSEAQRAALVGKLADLETRSGTQVVVLLVPTTQPEDIASYAQRVAAQWKIGRRDVGDGIVLVVAKNDRRVRIEVAKALEGAVPDLAAKHIIDEQITTAFKAGDFAGGLNRGVDALAARILGEALAAPTKRSSSTHAGVQWDELIMFMFVGVPIVGAVLTGMLGRRAGAFMTGLGSGGLAWVFSQSAVLTLAALLVGWLLVGLLGIGAMRRRGRVVGGRGGPAIWGGGDFGRDAGGFGSGGGGDFGGGGASGDW